MDKQEAYQEFRHYLREWEWALGDVDEVHAKEFVLSKSIVIPTEARVRRYLMPQDLGSYLRLIHCGPGTG